MKKTSKKIVVVLLIALTMGACDNGTTKKEVTEVTLTFTAITLPGPILNFKPVNLPVEITYILSDSINTWKSADGFNGVVNSSLYSPISEQTFTQTFYRDGQAIGSQTIKAAVGGGAVNFVGLTDTGDSPLSAIPSLKLTF